jgi:hypothetical protein
MASEYNKYNVFGSETSTDCDIMVFVDTIPEKPHECGHLAHDIQSKLSIDTPKKLNVNLAILCDGVIVKVYKGTPDETNNSIFDTYKYHILLQKYPLLIERPVERDINIKIVRSIRVILSMITRTNKRKEMKSSLSKDHLRSRVETLRTVKFEEIIFEKISDTMENIWKTIAFQIGQSMALIEGIEIFDKVAILEKYPTLAKFLRREKIDPIDLVELTKIMNIFLDKIDQLIIIDAKIADLSEF